MPRSRRLDPALSALLPEQESAGYPALSRDYPQDFAVDEAYKASLPDLQNGPASLIVGARQQIQHVGISNFRLPIRFHTRDNGDLTLETSVTGTVSLEAEKKGINMSRIMRSFYAHAERTFSFEVIEAALDDYKTATGKLRRADPDAVLVSDEAVVRCGPACRDTSITTSRWSWSNMAGFARRSCISTMSIPRPARARWS